MSGAADWSKAMYEVEGNIAQNMTNLMFQAGEGLQEELRDATRKAGFGNGVANAWRLRMYPQNGRSLDPAAYVFTKAPNIMASATKAQLIRPLGGRRYLAIPTDNVPGIGRGKTMTPHEVETYFNQDLIIRRNRRGTLLGLVKAIQARNKKGFRRATKGRQAQGRSVKLILMFIFVPFVRTRKAIDLDAAAERWSKWIAAAAAQEWKE
jgi:hypothetical protein